MLIKYWWRESEEWKDGVLRPACDCLSVITGFKGLIFNFLNDDEGQGLEYLNNWIDEGLLEVAKIKDDSLDSYDMWGHAWGAEITKENVLIYWGYDNTDCEENMSFDRFEKILKKWSKFLKTKPSIANIVEFEC